MFEKRKTDGKKAGRPAPAGKAKRASAAKPGASPRKSAAGAARTASPRGSVKKAENGPKTGFLKPRTPLRKPAPKRAVDLGIGAVEILPLKEAARTTGILAAEAAMDKKAFDVVVLDVRGISGLCDEMVVASARSATHLSAVCDGVEEALRKAGERVLHSDGRRSAEPDWILLDYGDLMVHLFRPEAREQTRLEDYYASARLVAKWKNEM